MDSYRDECRCPGRLIIRRNVCELDALCDVNEEALKDQSASYQYANPRNKKGFPILNLLYLF